MKVLYAYTSDCIPQGTTDCERMLVLEDGRAVILDPRGDVVLDTELAGLLKLQGCATLNDDLLRVWHEADGYPIMSAEEIEAVIAINDELERLDATMAISLIPGPSSDACVPEGFVRFVDDLETYVTVPYATAVSVLKQITNPRLIIASLQAWRVTADGAELWFAKDPFARGLHAGAIVYFHPLHGVCATAGVAREVYRVPPAA